MLSYKQVERTSKDLYQNTRRCDATMATWKLSSYLNEKKKRVTITKVK
jgi:hypothetical protein